MKFIIELKYFINYNSGSNNNKIIKCSENTCEAGEHQNGYYLDASYETTKEDTTGEGEQATTSSVKIITQLIKCDDSSCTTINKDDTQPLVAGYYLDASTYSDENNTEKYLGLIKCDEEKDGNTITGYSCSQVASTDMKKGYYLDSSTYITPDANSADEINYFKGLIYCDELTDNDGKVTYSCSQVTDINDGYYIDSSTLKTKADGTNPDYYDGLIYCIGEEVTKQDGSKVKNYTCKSFTDEFNNSIYVNQETKLLIQCSSVEKGCSSFASTASDTIPAYYINAARTDEATIKYKDDIIICEKPTGGDKIQCKILDGDEVKEHSVFLNANLKDVTNGATNDDDKITNSDSTDVSNQLIICLGYTCDLAASGVETGQPDEYYVNAGVYTGKIDEKDVSYNLIKCKVDATPVCSVEANPTLGNDENIFFVNGNYKNQPDKYLVKCTASGCDTYGTNGILSKYSAVEYFIYGDIDDADKLTNAILKISHGEAATATSTGRRKRNPENADTTTTTTPAIKFELVKAEDNDVYLNGADEAGKPLITCSTDGCTVDASNITEDDNDEFMSTLVNTPFKMLMVVFKIIN